MLFGNCLVIHKFQYKWFLKNGYPNNNGLNVFGTFICGGGSTMGYKLAGFNHLGGVEIDKKIADVYKHNHNSKYLYIEDLRKFNKRNNLPKELYNLDILDGSPPCSTFSMAGKREKVWGKEKQFREGQALQTLDDLVFVYIETINKLRPKVCILENVKGIIQGNAKYYAKEIVKRLNDIGYEVQVFCLNSSTMGVPQKRERVFFIGYKKELKYPKLKLEFNEKPICYFEIEDNKNIRKKATGKILLYLKKTKAGKSLSSVHEKGNFFTSIRCKYNDVVNTIASGSNLFHPIKNEYLTDNELSLAGSFPLDFNFKNVQPQYIIGMSVPPIMIAQIASQIQTQWFNSKFSII